jgi:hypothetical protein
MFGVETPQKKFWSGTNSSPGKFRILMGHFLKRLHNFELVATDADSRNTIVQILVLLSLPGQFLPFWFFFAPADLLPFFLQYQHRAILSFEFYFISFSMIITGLVTVLNWNSLFPDQTDHAILSVLPLHARVLFGSKLAALLVFQLTFTFLINFSSTLLFPYFAYVRIDGRESELAWTFVHAFSIVAGNLLIFSCLLCIQGLMLMLTSARLYPRLSLLVQLGLFVLFLTSLLMIPDIETYLAAFSQGHSQWLKYLPPAWILGLYENLMDRAGSPMTPLSPWAWRALAGTTVGAASLYYLSYRRHLRNAAASFPLPTRGSWIWLARIWNPLSLRFFREPRERAVFEFAWKTLCRSRLHQLYLLGYLGAGLAFLAQQLLGLWLAEGWAGFITSPMVLRAIPLGCGFFVVVGLRMIYAIPAELPANWIFQMTSEAVPAFGISAPRKAALWQILLPLHLLFFLMAWPLEGWKRALLEGSLNLLIALFLLEWLLRRFDRIPFTAAYQPGKARIHLMWPVYGAGFFVYSFLMALWEGYLMARPAAWLTFGALLLAGIVWMRRQALRSTGSPRSLIFDDAPDPLIQKLNLEY